MKTGGGHWSPCAVSLIQTRTECTGVQSLPEHRWSNPKLLLPWRGPYIVCSQSSQVVYFARRANETQEVSGHLAHLKPNHPRQKPPAPQLDHLANFFLGKRILLPPLDTSRPNSTQHRVPYHCSQPQTWSCSKKYPPLQVQLESARLRSWMRY